MLLRTLILIKNLAVTLYLLISSIIVLNIIERAIVLLIQLPMNVNIIDLSGLRRDSGLFKYILPSSSLKSLMFLQSILIYSQTRTTESIHN